MEYENIRIDTTDISKIAQNTGMPEWKISRIKDHVFSNEHILDAGVKRFDADPEIADAWYRLTNGTYNQNDIDLLNHEYFESKFVFIRLIIERHIIKQKNQEEYGIHIRRIINGSICENDKKV